MRRGLKLRKRRRRSRAQVERVPLPVPMQADERYSMDFMRDTSADGQVFRTLHIIDDYTRECLAIEVDTSLPGARVVRVFERLAAEGRRPVHLVVDNGPEFASKAVAHWAVRSGVNELDLAAQRAVQFPLPNQAAGNQVEGFSSVAVAPHHLRCPDRGYFQGEVLNEFIELTVRQLAVMI